MPHPPASPRRPLASLRRWPPRLRPMLQRSGTHPPKPAWRIAGLSCRRRLMPRPVKSTPRAQSSQSVRTAAEREIAEASAAIARHKTPESATPLADRIGIAALALDLVAAALGSIAANGLAYGLLIFAAHPRKNATSRCEVVLPAPSGR